MCYDKEKNGKESYNHGKMDEKIIGSCCNRQCRCRSCYYFKKSKKDVDEDFKDDFEDEDFDLDNDLQPVDRGYVDLNAGKASPEEADDAEETETGEDTLDADAHEGKED